MDAISDQTMLGAMASYISDPEVSKRFQPMNANFGIVPLLGHKVKGGKTARHEAYAERSLSVIDDIISQIF